MTTTSWKPGDPIVAPQFTFTLFDPASLSVRDMYRYMVHTIVPRPIALVSTRGKNGVDNLAPFSFFNGVSSNPPCVMISIAAQRKGEKKDTLRNIEETKEFVVNTSSQWLMGPIAHAGAAYPSEVSELDELQFTRIPSTKVLPYRIKESPVHFECVLHSSLPIGDGSPGSSVLVVGKIVAFHIAQEIMENGEIVQEKLEPLSRIGNIGFGSNGTIDNLPTPHDPVRR